MSKEKEYILKVIERMESKLPSKWDLAMITYLKIKWLPRLKSYINGEVYQEKETEVDIVKEAERIMNE